MPSRAKKTGVLGTAWHCQSSALFCKGRAVRNFFARKFKDRSCKEQQTAATASNIAGEKKERENKYFAGICCFFTAK